MENEIIILDENDLKNKIYTIRGVQVMLDSDLAQIYGYETKRFNEQVKNNIERFDEDFRFQLTDDEVKIVSRSKISTLNDEPQGRGHNIKYNPYAFTEQGIYMLMTVLKGELAVKQSKTLIRLFKQMKDFVLTNSQLFAEIDSIKKHLIESDLHHKENDKRIDELFTLMDKYKIEEKQGIFFQGQIFDAYAKFESFIQSARIWGTRLSCRGGMENKIKVFENKNIRTVWNEEEEDWYFSVVDIIEILTGTERPRKYWNDLKKKLTIEGSELSEKIGQLKMAAADGKMRETDVLSTKNVLRLVQ